MKRIIISLLIVISFVYSDEFDLGGSSSSDDGTLFPMNDMDLEKFTPVIFKITEKELRKFIPLIHRMLTKEEQLEQNMQIAEVKAEKKRVDKATKEKISGNFTKKETLQKVEKVKTEVKANGADADFFNSLDDGDSKPIDME